MKQEAYVILTAPYYNELTFPIGYTIFKREAIAYLRSKGFKYSSKQKIFLDDKNSEWAEIVKIPFVGIPVPMYKVTQ